jgi:hypothetical protein
MHKEADISENHGLPCHPLVREPGAASEGAESDLRERVGN